MITSGFYVIYLDLFFFIFGAQTKSAQLVFMGWLPQAMAAPTPVRALVHSSTLVTAGIFIIFILLYYFGLNFQVFLIFSGLVSGCFSRLLSLFEKDGKKLVA